MAPAPLRVAFEAGALVVTGAPVVDAVVGLEVAEGVVEAGVDALQPERTITAKSEMAITRMNHLFVILNKLTTPFYISLKRETSMSQLLC